jgi:hypothetical protein
MKTIKLIWVEYQLVTLEFDESIESDIMDTLEIEPGDGNVKEIVLEFGEKIKECKAEHKNLNVQLEHKFNLVCDSSWIVYELPAMLARNISSANLIPKYICDAYRSYHLEFIYSGEGDISEESIMELIPVEFHSSQFAIYNQFLFRDLMDVGGWIWEGQDFFVDAILS